MFAKKLFEVLAFALLYLMLTLLWFAYVVPEMLDSGTDAALIAAGSGTLLWIASAGCIVVYIIEKARP